MQGCAAWCEERVGGEYRGWRRGCVGGSTRVLDLACERDAPLGERRDHVLVADGRAHWVLSPRARWVRTRHC
eukprot:129269-Rhodomonas_salina.1